MIRRKPKPKPNYANIRRLELELGLREWDADDDRALHFELLTQLRYVNPETVAERIAERKALVQRGLLQSGYAAMICGHPTGPLPYGHSSRKHLARESSIS